MRPKNLINHQKPSDKLREKFLLYYIIVKKESPQLVVSSMANVGTLYLGGSASLATLAGLATLLQLCYS